MANLRNHQVMETWKSNMDPEHLVHFTKNERVVRTGVRGGQAKICFITDKGVLNFSGQGQRATVANFKQKYPHMAGWERVR